MCLIMLTYENVWQCSKSMKEHGRELDDDDRKEEKHEHDTDRLQMKVLFRNNYLKLAKKTKIIKNSFMVDNVRGEEIIRK